MKPASVAKKRMRQRRAAAQLLQALQDGANDFHACSMHTRPTHCARGAVPHYPQLLTGTHLLAGNTNALLESLAVDARPLAGSVCSDAFRSTTKGNTVCKLTQLCAYICVCETDGTVAVRSVCSPPPKAPQSVAAATALCAYVCAGVHT